MKWHDFHNSIYEYVNSHLNKTLDMYCIIVCFGRFELLNTGSDNIKNMRLTK